MPGSEADMGRPVGGHVEPSVGLQEAKAPLPYLRSRNALKIILDLDENFGKPAPHKIKGWLSLGGLGAKKESDPTVSV